MSKTVFTFPGQGAQSVGMGKALYDGSREAREIYQQANQYIGYDLAALCFEGPQEELTRTDRCQPALLVTGYAAYAALIAKTGHAQPMAFAGLSLGEITALVAANAIRFKDALYLVQVRGEAMSECAERNPGAMLAVMGLDFDSVDAVCAQSGAQAANFNSHDQVVLSGAAEAIEKAKAAAQERGAKRVIPLEVSGAFHSSLMREAADKLKAALDKVEIHTPVIPVISNVTAETVRDGAHIKELLVKQVVSSVCWSQSVERLIAQGAEKFVEFAPAKVLTALLRRINREVQAVMVNEPGDFDKV